MRLIAIGFNVAGTGLTRVMSSVMRRLADRHEIHFLGIGYSGEIVRDRGLTIYPTNPKGGDVFAAFQAKRLIDEIQPALILVMHDLWMFDYYLRLFGPYRDRLKVVACIPLDGRIANEADAAPLAQADRVVAYTQFARAEFEGAFRRLREKQADRDFPAVDVIPHGVDRDRFHPLPELEQASFASRAARRRNDACSASLPTPASRLSSSMQAGPTSANASTSPSAGSPCSPPASRRTSGCASITPSWAMQPNESSGR